jgi:hypothetical protein
MRNPLEPRWTKTVVASLRMTMVRIAATQIVVMGAATIAVRAIWGPINRNCRCPPHR